MKSTYQLIKERVKALEEEIQRQEKAQVILDNQNAELQGIINKAIDKLYCYGEVFDREILQQFQKEMLDILQESDKE